MRFQRLDCAASIYYAVMTITLPLLYRMGAFRYHAASFDSTRFRVRSLIVPIEPLVKRRKLHRLPSSSYQAGGRFLP